MKKIVLLIINSIPVTFILFIASVVVSIISLLRGDGFGVLFIMLPMSLVMIVTMKLELTGRNNDNNS